MSQAFLSSQNTSLKKKKDGLKIVLSILSGCVLILVVVGIVGYFMVKKAEKKAEEEWKKALSEIEKTEERGRFF